MKRLTDDECTTGKGRPFQTRIVLGKKEYLHAFTEVNRGINLQSRDLLVPWKPTILAKNPWNTPFPCAMLRWHFTVLLTTTTLQKGGEQKWCKNVQSVSRFLSKIVWMSMRRIWKVTLEKKWSLGQCVACLIVVVVWMCEEGL